MGLMGKCNIPFVWITPAGMKIRFALGKVKNKRAGKGLIKTGSGVQINIIDRSKIDIAKSVTALMPNFVHSLDASCIHELTFDLFTQLRNDIKLPNKVESSSDLYVSEERRARNLFLQFVYESYDQSDYLSKDNTYFDSDLVSNIDLKTLGALKNTIPLYTIHDCFATTANNMALIKKSVTVLFSEMYFFLFKKKGENLTYN